MIDVVVMAHPARREQAFLLAEATDATIVWDQLEDEWDTGARALREFDPCATHHIVLQDDAIPVPGFIEHAEHAIAARWHDPISFYIGTSRPPQWQSNVDKATAAADAEGLAWLTAEQLLHGVAVAVPTHDIVPLLAWCRHSTFPYDERIGAWYRTQRRLIAYTWPSLVDHADDGTLVQHADHRPRRRPRVARKVGVPATWHTPAAHIATPEAAWPAASATVSATAPTVASATH
jgi:hypothetical protein